MRRLGVALAVVLTVSPFVSGCSGDPTEDYCQAVEAHQRQLGEIAASTEPGALFDALEAYRELQEDAPPDLRDEWEDVVGRIERLRDAVEDAGIDPATYDPGELKDLSQQDRQAVTAAARALGEPTTREAMAGIEQQALDVCGTPLSQ